MTDAELAEHWRNLAECERGGAKPVVYRQLLEEIRRLREAKPDPAWFCDRMDLWAGLAEIHKGNLTPDFVMHWQNVRLAISKSCLLDRMFYGGERPSQTPCPVHKGKWSGCHWGWPGAISVAVTDHAGHKAGGAFPAPESAGCREWYDAGCRCAYHNCGCTTGWQPDEHCGCGGEEHRMQVLREKYGSRLKVS